MKMEFRIFFILLLLFSFYQLGLPVQIILIFGAVSLFFGLFRGKISKTIDELMHNHIPGFKGQHPWIKKIILLIALIIFLIIVKQLLYLILAQLGFDMQKMMLESFDKIQKQA
ncbi:MAG: hypothetical protein WC501_04290 [Candidatus Micrarchaeia archaeon]|jgi:hypothetical protein